MKLNIQPSKLVPPFIKNRFRNNKSKIEVVASGSITIPGHEFVVSYDLKLKMKGDEQLSRLITSLVMESVEAEPLDVKTTRQDEGPGEGALIVTPATA